MYYSGALTPCPRLNVKKNRRRKHLKTDLRRNHFFVFLCFFISIIQELPLICITVTVELINWPE